MFNVKVIAVDLNDDKLTVAKEIGVDITINPLTDEDAEKSVQTRCLNEVQDVFEEMEQDRFQGRMVLDFQYKE